MGFKNNILKNKSAIKRILIGAMVGGFMGYLYYYFIGCNTGTCAITSNPINSIIYGLLLGGLLTELVNDIKNIIKKRFDKNK